jgi:hypothetical protein
MGTELTCDGILDGKELRGKARLETAALQFRAPGVRFNAPFKDIAKIGTRGGMLTVHAPAGAIALSLGSDAEKWADKIRNPPTRLKKLGVKASWRAAVLGTVDAEFVAELAPAVIALSRTASGKAHDAVFLFLETAFDLARVAQARRLIAPDGALWLIRRKGEPTLTEPAVMKAGKAAGLVDVKVVAFSATHSALKFVVPLARR